MPPRRGRGSHIHGTATEDTPLIQDRSRSAGIDWVETYRFVRPYVIPETTKLRLTAVFSLTMVILNKVAILIPPYAYKLAVDALAANLAGGPLVIPYNAVYLYVGSRLCADLFQSLRSYSFSVVAADCTRRFSVDMFRHLQNLSLAFHLQRKTGEVTKVMDRGTQSIETLLNTTLFTLFPV